MSQKNKTIIRAFIYFTLLGSSFYGIGMSVVSGNINKGIILGLLFGSFLGIFLSFFLFLGLTLFERKLLFYGNMPKQLKARGVKDIHYESVAGNATGSRIKYGGLFLTNDSVLFIPHKFAIKPLFVELPLNELKEVKKTGINLLKHFSGGLRKRLLLETTNGKHYEFSVWDIDAWITKINDSLNPSSPSRQTP